LSALLTKHYLGDKIKKNEMGGSCMGRGKLHTEFWWGNLSERHHLENVGVDGRIILKLISGSDIGALSESIWQRIGTDGGLL
jgi:hypothetical protein